jgi:DNA-binding NtrC family response regulator
VFLQAKLLRALDTGEVRRLGSARLVRVNVRLIAATNRDLRTDVEAGRFRKDLYWRLSDDSITLPPLRERPGDVRLLATHFAHDHGVTLSSGAIALLEACPWPGNVRELRSAIARAAAFATGSEIQPEDFPTAIRSNHNHRLVGGGSLRLEDAVRQHVLDVLSRTRGKQAEAATLLGIDRKTLRRKLRQYTVRDDKARGNGTWR